MGTSSLHLLRLMAAYLAEHGADGKAFAAGVGVSPEELASPDTRVSTLRLAGVWPRFAAACGLDDVGLRLAQWSGASAFGLFGYLATKSCTVADAARRAQQYFALITDALRFELSVADGVAVVELQVMHGIPMDRDRNDFCIAYFHLQTAAVLERWKLIGASFAHPKPRSTSRYDSIFGLPVDFDAEKSCFRFDSELLDVEVASGESELARILEEHARQRLERCRSDDFVSKVREHCLRQLERGDCSISAVAKALGLSRRSLQRRLAELGTTHSRVLDEVRRELSTTLLRDNRASLFDIAMVLGFSDQTAFQRAFRRWTGTTPGRARKTP